MKRSTLILVLVLVLSGCAAQQKTIKHFPDHPIGSQVSSLFITVLERNGYTYTDVRYCIWDNPEVNAWMTSSNTLVITTGLLNQLLPEGNKRKEQVLVSVIAHELAHFKLRHVERKDTVNTATDIGVSATLLIVEFATGVPVGLAGYLITPTITSAYSRSQEIKADTEAVCILRNAGVMDPARNYADALEWFDTKRPAEGWGLWNTHPPTSERVENVMRWN